MDNYTCEIDACNFTTFDKRKTQRIPKYNIRVCKSCERYHRTNHKRYNSKKEFVQARNLFLLRPTPYVKAEELNLIQKVENPVLTSTEAKCSCCSKIAKIQNPTYQLCGNCANIMRYKGHKCEICNHYDSRSWDREELVLHCGRCQKIKCMYGIKLKDYRDKILPITNCQMCNKEVNHNDNGNYSNSAFIDHDHDTGENRAILCPNCNSIEGFSNAIIKDTNNSIDNVHQLADMLIKYRNAPPPFRSLIQ